MSLDYKNIVVNYDGYKFIWSFLNYEYKVEGTFLRFLVDKSPYTKEYYWLQKYGNLNIPFDVDIIPDPENRINKIVGYWEVLNYSTNHYNFNKNGIIRSSDNWTIGKQVPEIFRKLFDTEKNHISIFIS